MPPELPDPAGTELSGNPAPESVHDVETDPAPAPHEAGPDVAAEEHGGSGAPVADPKAGAGPGHQASTRRLVVLAVAAVLLIAAAVVLAFANHRARANGPLSNEAFVDAGITSAVEGEATAAIKTIYSYDYRTLDANQAAAKAVTTGQFSQDLDKVFDAVKQLAPKEQAVMTIAVPAAGVLELGGDRARLLMMVDQNGTKGGSQPIAGASARLVVVAQLVDGHWKIAEVTPE